MDDEERKHRAACLESLLASPGGKILTKYLEEEIREGWESFIALPVEKKTCKAAYDAQAKYKVLKGITDWMNTEIKLGKALKGTIIWANDKD